MRNVLIAILLLGLASGASAAGGNPVKGKEKSAPCAACHGPDGNKPLDETHPRLAGQYEDYLYHALKSYKTGGRKNAVMVGQVAALSDADLRNLAAYFASQKGQVKDLTAK